MPSWLRPASTSSMSDGQKTSLGVAGVAGVAVVAGVAGIAMSLAGEDPDGAGEQYIIW
jgi:hypothetical protein